MKPKSLVRLQIHQDFGHSLSVRPFAELSDRVRSDDRGSGQVPKEIPSLADAQAGDVAYRTPTQVAHTRQLSSRPRRGASRLLFHPPRFIPYVGRHRDTTKRRVAGAARRSVRSGSSLLVGVGRLRVRADRLLRSGTTRTYAGRGFSPGGDMAGVAATADPRVMSSSRATRTASSALSCRTAGALGLLGPLLDVLPGFEPPEVRGRHLCRGPPAAVHHDQAVFARRVSVATLRAPDRAVRSSALTDRRQGRRERAPPRPSAPPTGSRRSTAQREDERQPICGLAGAGPPHDPRSVLRSGRCAKEAS
jgi:hypothetical protein